MHKILIIEDEDLLLWAIEEYLKKKGYQTLTSHTGERAVGLVKEQSVDLVVSDLFLPDTSGLGVIEEIHRLRPDLPIIVITASPLTEEEMDRIEGLVHKVILKPFEIKRLEGVVQEIMGDKVSLVDPLPEHDGPEEDQL
jgi:DNA-binding response OmpR family regulator